MHTRLSHDHRHAVATRARQAALALVIIAMLGIGVAGRAQASCCECLLCGQAGECFTTGEAPNKCLGQCATECPTLSDEEATCAYGGDLNLSNCLTIDGVSPTPTSTPTDTPTATATVTVTGTVTETPTVTPVPQGGACSDTAQCVPALFCADGVCCDSACTDPLMQCNLPGQAGTCTSTAAEAPTLTPRALLLALVVLGGLAAWALRRRARGGQPA